MPAEAGLQERALDQRAILVLNFNSLCNTHTTECNNNITMLLLCNNITLCDNNIIGKDPGAGKD